MKNQSKNILHLTGLSEMDFCNLQYSQGLVWLELNDTLWVFEDSRLFWNWWKNQWTIRDTKFITDYGDSDAPTAALHNIYLRRQDAHRLMNIYPHSSIMKAAYNEFVIKEGKERSWQLN